jgi:hypothetical protein
MRRILENFANYLTLKRQITTMKIGALLFLVEYSFDHTHACWVHEYY